MKNIYRFTYRHAAFFWGNPYGVVDIEAPSEEYAKKRYYSEFRGKKIPHDIAIISIKKLP